MSYLLLRRSQRKAIRNVTRKAWLDAGCNVDKAKELAEAEIRTGSIVIAILIGVAIKLAFALIMHFWNKRVVVPESDYQPDEPGF